MSGVPANKQFTITFSSNIDASKIDAIVIKQDNRFIPVDITYDTNKAYVTPVKSFGDGEYDFRIFLSNGKKYSLKFTASNTEDYTTTASNDKVIKVYPRSTSGFSASARFTNRFALLHSEMVQAVATGGINSEPIIPLNQLEGQTLTYPVGIGDVQSITGTPVNLEAYKSVKQYIYMGENDANDDVPFSDGYDDNERNEIYTLLGKKQLPDRWNKVQQIFSTLPYPIQFVTYKSIGHEAPYYVGDDIANFFNQNSGDTFTKIQPQNAY